MWNAIGTPGQYAHKSAVLDEWCRRLGRAPGEIERTANVTVRTEQEAEAWLRAGARHLVLRLAHPFGTKDLK